MLGDKFKHFFQHLLIDFMVFINEAFEKISIFIDFCVYFLDAFCEMDLLKQLEGKFDVLEAHIIKRYNFYKSVDNHYSLLWNVKIFLYDGNYKKIVYIMHELIKHSV